MIEFNCQDCGHRVVSFYIPDADRLCASCFWIRQRVPPDEQTEVRERLGVPLKKGDPS